MSAATPVPQHDTCGVVDLQSRGRGCETSTKRSIDVLPSI